MQLVCITDAYHTSCVSYSGSLHEHEIAMDFKGFTEERSLCLPNTNLCS
jgi:hypothetical protein